MPVIKEISASYGRKQSDGNYGSRDVFLSLTAEIGPEEDTKEVSETLFATCYEMVVAKFTEGVETGEAVNDMTTSAPAVVTSKNPVSISLPPAQPKFEWRNTKNGEAHMVAKAEDNEEHGAENGPRGSSFEG